MYIKLISRLCLSFPLAVLQYQQGNNVLSSSADGSGSGDPGFSPGDGGAAVGNSGYAYTTSCLVKGEHQRGVHARGSGLGTGCPRKKKNVKFEMRCHFLLGLPICHNF